MFLYDKLLAQKFVRHWIPKMVHTISCHLSSCKGEPKVTTPAFLICGILELFEFSICPSGLGGI